VRLPRLKPLAWIAAAGMLVAASSLAYLGLQVDSSQDLVLLRNAVIAEVEPEGAHEWTPDSIPADYLAETLPTPEPLERFAMEARGGSTPSDDFETAVSLARALGQNRKRGRGPILDDTVTALERITADGAGYCADGGFQWSLQHLDTGGVVWDDHKVGLQSGRDGHRCTRPVGLVSISGQPSRRFGRALPQERRVKKRHCPVACRSHWVRVGFATLAGFHR